MTTPEHAGLSQPEMIRLFCDCWEETTRQLAEANAPLMDLRVAAQEWISDWKQRSEKQLMKDMDLSFTSELTKWFTALSSLCGNHLEAMQQLERAHQRSRTLVAYRPALDALFSAAGAFQGTEGLARVWVPACGEAPEIGWLTSAFPSARFWLSDISETDTLWVRGALSRLPEHEQSRCKATCTDLLRPESFPEVSCDSVFWFHPLLTPHATYAEIINAVRSARNEQKARESLASFSVAADAVGIFENLFSALSAGGQLWVTLLEESEVELFCRYLHQTGRSHQVRKNRYAIRMLSQYLARPKPPRLLQARSYGFLVHVVKS